MGLSRDVLRYERLRERRERAEYPRRQAPTRATDHRRRNNQHRGSELRDRGKHRRESLYPKANGTLLQRPDKAMRSRLQWMRNLSGLLWDPYALEMSLCPPLEFIVYCNLECDSMYFYFYMLHFTFYILHVLCDKNLIPLYTLKQN